MHAFEIPFISRIQCLHTYIASVLQYKYADIVKFVIFLITKISKINVLPIYFQIQDVRSKPILLFTYHGYAYLDLLPKALLCAQQSGHEFSNK